MGSHAPEQVFEHIVGYGDICHRGIIILFIAREKFFPSHNINFQRLHQQLVAFNGFYITAEGAACYGKSVYSRRLNMMLVFHILKHCVFNDNIFAVSHAKQGRTVPKFRRPGAAFNGNIPKSAGAGINFPISSQSKQGSADSGIFHHSSRRKGKMGITVEI